MGFIRGFPAGPRQGRGRPRLCWVGVAAALAAAWPLPAQAPQADASLPLFTVMAAVNAAAADGPSPGPVARQLRQELAGKALPSLEELRHFHAAHRLPDPLRQYSRYVSFGLVIDGPPDFAFRVREAELPPDARALEGLNPLLAAFYAEAELEKLWEKYRPAYDQVAEEYQEGIARTMLEVNGYLRNPTAGYLGRSFSVYIDMLGPPNQVNARSFGPDYYVVVTPSAHLQLEELRHGYLHYVLEPLAAKHSVLLRAREKLLEVAARAPALDPVLRSDFKLLLCESLIRAVELRMTRASAVAVPQGGSASLDVAVAAKGASLDVADADRQKRLEEVAAEGHFLAAYFFEALQKFEQQDAGIRLYYPTLIEKLEVGREERRAEKIAFRAAPASDPPLSGHLSETARQPAASEELERLLAEGEDAIARLDPAAARQAYQAALERSASNGPGRARALYGLALVATQQKQPEVAKNFFQQTLEAARQPQLLAWAHIYLGRLFDMENNRNLALRHYRQALESGDPGPGTRLAAQRGLEQPFRAP